MQNATLAGGVAVGTAANYLIQPWGSVVIGCIAGVLSVIGYQYLQVRTKVHDLLPLLLYMLICARQTKP